MKKLRKRHAAVIFALALTAAFVIRDFNTSKFEIIRNSEVAAPGKLPQGPPAEADTEPQESQSDGVITPEGKVNINAASAAELAELSGVGAGIAERIIEYRTEHGKFEVIEDIMKVSGIGESKFAAVKDYIVVE